MPDHLRALPAGHLLGEYRIDDVLGSGGFGITYLAWDTQLEKQVAIKEYLPIELALRADAATVHPISTTHQADYQWGLERFLDEARTLARFEHPHLNKVYRFFEANGTAYMVLEYIEGETLAARLKREGPLGAARQALDQRSNSITSILAPGYAPIKQYGQSAANVGPWADFHALGMAAHRCLSGIGDGQLPGAITRCYLKCKGKQHKTLAPAVEVGKSRHNQAPPKAMDRAIKAGEGQRPQGAAAIRQALAGDDSLARPRPAPLANRPGKRRRARSLSMLAAVGVAAAGIVGCSPLDGHHEAEAEAFLTVAEAEIRLFSEIFGRAPSPDANNVDGLTDLHYAAAANMPELARFLLDAGAKANARAYEDGESFAETSRRKLQELTKTNTSDDWSRTRLGQAPLHLSAAFDARETTELLIARGANVNAKDQYGRTPLDRAALKNARETAELLIARGADVNAKGDYGGTPLHLAAWENARETAELLIARGANFNAKNNTGWTPLHTAIWKNARETAELLIARGANVNAKDNEGDTPLHYAAKKNAREMAELLIASGANVNAKDNGGNTPLHQAARANAREMAELLIAHDANVRAKGKYGTSLHYAARYNAREAAELLIASGANVNAKGGDGRETPLHDAARYNAREAAELLIASGANVNAKDNDDETPLHWAAYQNAREVAELLIARGADVNAKDESGETPLHDAAWENAHEAAELLITRGANINATTYIGGQTPLHYAAWRNAREAAKLLIARGADVNARSSSGLTPRNIGI